MGVEDREFGLEMVEAAKRKVCLERIEYRKMNTIQTLDDSNVERRFNQLLKGVGPIVSGDPRYGFKKKSAERLINI